MQDKIKGLKGVEEFIIKNLTISSNSSRNSNPILTGIEAAKATINEHIKPQDEKIVITESLIDLDGKVKKFKEIDKDQIKADGSQAIFKEIKDILEILHTEKTRLEEIANKKAALEKEISSLTEISNYEEEGTEYNKYYNNIVNKVLVYKSITKNYDLVKALWISSVAGDFIKVMEKDYYKKLGKSNHSDYIEHMKSCVKSPIFPELFSNILMPLYNHKVEGDCNMLLKILNTLYPGVNNELKAEKILKVYDTLVKKGEHDLTDVAEVMIYTKQIWKIVCDVIKSYYYEDEKKDKKCDFLECIANDNLPELDKPSKEVSICSADLKSNSSITEAKSETKRLEDKEELTAKSMLVDLVFKKIKDKFGGCASKEHWVESDPSKQEKVAFISSEIGRMIRDMKPLPFRKIVSPNAECLNSVHKVLPIDKLSTIVNDMVAKQWCEETLCARSR